MKPITSEERLLIEKFETTFNRIQKQMANDLNRRSNGDSFGHLLNLYEDSHKIRSKDARFLNRCRELRNHLVHDTLEPNEYLALPKKGVVEQIEAVAERVSNPMRVYPRFNQDVFKVSTSDSLYQVLKWIRQNDYSQFPVYDDDTFVGLLTENGITRWIAYEATNNEVELADLEKTVQDALALQEASKNYHFVPRNMMIIEALNIYALDPEVEALLINQEGSPEHSLLGIMTRYDALNILDEYK